MFAFRMLMHDLHPLAAATTTTTRCSISELVIGTFVDVLPSAWGFHFANDSVSVVYGVGRHVQLFTYALDFGDGTEERVLTNFVPLDDDSEVSSAAAASAAAADDDAYAVTVGGRLTHRYVAPGTYDVSFAVSTGPRVNRSRSDRDLVAVATAVVQRRPTMQVGNISML